MAFTLNVFKHARRRKFPGEDIKPDNQGVSVYHSGTIFQLIVYFYFEKQ